MTRSGLDRVLYTGPFHAALRNAIRERGLTLDRLRAHLARRGLSVGLSSLSEWQTGQSRPVHPGSRRAVRVLEDILGLPPTSLVRLLGGGNGPREGLSDIGPVAELLDAVPGSRDCAVELISTQHKIVIDADGRTALVWTRAAIRALRNGVERYVARYYGGRECDPALVRVRPPSHRGAGAEQAQHGSSHRVGGRFRCAGHQVGLAVSAGDHTAREPDGR